MMELEKKLLLSRDEYSFLLEHFGEGKPHSKQINYYFDTEDLSMNQKNITCRIRLKDGRYRGTMKRHISNTDSSEEIEMEARNGVYDNGFTDMGLQLQGVLITERCIILKDSICEVVLDKNSYLGHTDYELEIEYSLNYEEHALSVLKSILNVLGNQRHFSAAFEGIKQSSPSKSNRFFQRRIQK